jgi:hypothetical protein
VFLFYKKLEIIKFKVKYIMSKASQRKLSKKKNLKPSANSSAGASTAVPNPSLAKAYTQPKPAMPTRPMNAKPVLPQKAGRKR